MESIIQRRRRSSAMILQLLQDHRSGMTLGSENQSSDQDQDLLTNTFNRATSGGASSHGSSENSNTVSGSLGDYFIGPRLDLLLQHLAENDPNRYGTLPARKEAIVALPTVNVKETCQCSICLDDLEVKSEAKEIPCKHKFYGGCILRWLELHSSCPVCRFQLPADESKCKSSRDGNGSRARDGESSVTYRYYGRGGERRNRSRRFVTTWPFMWSSTSSANVGWRSSTADEQ
ncbi:hypothetical protein SAY86_017642 [Trapa natans]|uniref:RING-type E3 ubiquitin transferase n=1 Tax=Trapa natans TaxID=22666 RepID=A0AAN7R907_TRANT|nr:hypothetical protein SAY86_017642 [Trapa natans]